MLAFVVAAAIAMLIVSIGFVVFQLVAGVLGVLLLWVFAQLDNIDFDKDSHDD